MVTLLAFIANLILQVIMQYAALIVLSGKSQCHFGHRLFHFDGNGVIRLLAAEPSTAD
jgi:hypothetical protein